MTRRTSSSVRRLAAALQSGAQESAPALPDGSRAARRGRTPGPRRRGPRARRASVRTGGPRGHARGRLRPELRVPGMALLVEAVAEQAVGGDLLLRRRRSRRGICGRPRSRGIATSALLLRLRHVVAVGALRLRVAAVVEARVRHPAVVLPDRAPRSTPGPSGPSLRVISWQVLQTRISKRSSAPARTCARLARRLPNSACVTSAALPSASASAARRSASEARRDGAAAPRRARRRPSRSCRACRSAPGSRRTRAPP